MNSLISPAEARSLIDTHLKPLPAIECPLDKCGGRSLREPVKTDRPFPPFNRAMMDGYAIRAADTQKVQTFKVVDQAPAGTPAKVLNRAIGSCIEIMTGAVVPEGADCVVPYEVTKRLEDDSIKLIDHHEHTAGNSIHAASSDHSTGAPLVEIGRLIGSREVAIAATCGYTSLKVSKLPSITIVSTGDELVPISEVPDAHQIRRSNDIAIETALARAGLPAKESVHLVDDPTIAIKALEELIKANDIVIISGGISMGKKDFIPEALTTSRLECRFHGVAQKPGKPLGFWTHENCAVFALPGNPISTLTCLHQYVLPSLQKAMGSRDTVPGQRVQLVEPVRARDDITIFLPVKLGAGNTALSRPAQNSGDLVRILKSDGYIELPPNRSKAYPKGQCFEFHPWL